MYAKFTATRFLFLSYKMLYELKWYKYILVCTVHAMLARRARVVGCIISWCGMTSPWIVPLWLDLFLSDWTPLSCHLLHTLFKSFCCMLIISTIFSVYMYLYTFCRFCLEFNLNKMFHSKEVAWGSNINHEQSGRRQIFWTTVVHCVCPLLPLIM